MKIKRIILLVFSCFFTFSCLPIFPQAGSYTAPKVSADKFVIGISLLRGINLSPGNEHLTRSIPQIIISGIRNLQVHSLSAEESLGLQKRTLSDEIEKEKKALSSLYKRRDSLIFEPFSSKALTQVNNDILKKIEYINFLVDYDPRKLETPFEMTIQLNPDNQKGLLLEVPYPDPFLYARKNKVDYYIWGSLEEVQGVLFITVYSYNALTGRDVELLKIGGSRDNIQRNTGELLKRLYRILYNKPIGYLTISGEPESALIMVNGEVLGTGVLKDYPYPPGLLNIVISQKGFTDSLYQYELSEEEEYSLSFALEKRDILSIPINTYPAGADTYRNAHWIGKTPFFYSFYGDRDELAFYLEGYDEYRMILPAEAPPSIDLYLRPVYYDRKEFRENRRKDFYNSFGRFAFSIAAPMLFYSFAEDKINTALLSNNREQQIALLREAELWYNGYIAAFAVSGVLFIDMVINLVSYVSSSAR